MLLAQPIVPQQKKVGRSLLLSQWRKQDKKVKRV